MKRVCVLTLFAVALIPVASARGASTRAEYITQVDPICQSFVEPAKAAFAAFRRNDKRMAHLSGSGTVKAWLNATRRTSHSLSRVAQIDASMIDQIATVAPAAADAGTINTWLNIRRQYDAFAAAGAAALNRPVPQIGKYFKLGKQASASAVAGHRAIEGFGFQVCDVSV